MRVFVQVPSDALSSDIGGYFSAKLAQELSKLGMVDTPRMVGVRRIEQQLEKMLRHLKGRFRFRMTGYFSLPAAVWIGLVVWSRRHGQWYEVTHTHTNVEACTKEPLQ